MEHYRCDRVLQFSVLGLRESEMALDEDRLKHIVLEATRLLSRPAESRDPSQLFSAPPLQLCDSHVTVTVSGDSRDSIITVLKEEKILVEVPVSGVRKVTVVDVDRTHLVIVAQLTGNKFVSNRSSQLVLSLNMPSKKYADTLIEILKVLECFSPSSNLDQRHEALSSPNCVGGQGRGAQLTPSASVYGSSAGQTVAEGCNSSEIDIYEPSTHVFNLTDDVSKLIRNEKAFVAQLKQCMKKARWQVEIQEIVENMVKLHQSACFSLETGSTQSLMRCLKENLKTIGEHNIFFDYVSVYGTRSQDLKVDIVSCLCSLKRWVEADHNSPAVDRTEVLETLSKTINTISDRQILLQIDQDKFNVMKCGEVVLQGSIFQLVKKKQVPVYSILTQEVLILTTPEYSYITHVLAHKMASVVAYKESATELVVTVDAKVSEKKLHLKAKDANTMRSWLISLQYVIKKCIELYF